MEAKHIMVGDLVKYNNGRRPMIGKVSFLSETGHVLLKFADGSDSIHTNIANIESIPLSIEMIEDLGAIEINYILDGKPFGAFLFTGYDENQTISLTLLRCNEDGFIINLYDDSDYVCFLIEELSYLPVQYVQTLQDCLRLYGMSDIAKMFDVGVIKNILL